MIIECEKLSKVYGNTQALHDVSFRIEGTGCVGFLGGNGAGKTTTIRILTGLASPTSGGVKVVGYDAVRERPEIRKQIGYLPQTPAFYNYMTGEEWMYWTGSLFKMDKAEIKSRTEELLQECGVWEARKRPIGGYSGGMKQRLGIAQALLNQPKLLILDEPVSALDPMGRHDVLMLIEKLKDSMTIFMSTHILDDVERVADHVVIIDKGKIILQSGMRDLRERYSEPIISFEVSSNDPDLTLVLKNIPWITDVYREGFAYRVSVLDIQGARSELPRVILEQGATLTSYNISISTLEDIFMKVVNN
jgi:ABC-2 type transport system ATP-binding protein